jgi:hypothetical protein
MPYPTHLLPTTVVGSYPQPIWLVDGELLKQHGVPRVHAHGIWRVPEALLEQAQDDGTILAIREMERAGIDIVTDGEIRRESYSNRFALALEGIDADHPGEVRSQTGRATPVPRVVGKIRRRGPVELRAETFSILLHHAVNAELLQSFGGRRHTDQPAAVLGHEIHGGGRDKLRGHDEVALILAVGVVHDNDHFTFAKVGDDGFDAVKSIFHSAGVA